jgi:hypothetical protein
MDIWIVSVLTPPSWGANPVSGEHGLLIEELLADYPYIEREDIMQALDPLSRNLVPGTCAFTVDVPNKKG